ncbi:hypothetical protein L0128_21585 [candidate division KSB1 bacterium]|nr:hypothetical protein [candidate division KSB1 bacterium]
MKCRAGFWLLSLFVLPLYSQQDITRYCRYNNLQWAPNGEQFAFQCYYFEEGQTVLPPAQVFLKDFKSQSLLSLNPQPQRLVLSPNKRQVLFSSLYGLYLMDLQKPERCGQLLFHNPAGDELISDFGFWGSAFLIYLKRQDLWGEKSTEEWWQVDSTKFKTQTGRHWLIGRKIPRKSGRLAVSGVAGPNTARQNQFTVARFKFRYQFKARTGTEADLMDLFKINLKTGKAVKLLEKIRPRLVSISPDSSRCLISVWQAPNQERTWINPLTSDQLTLAGNWGVKFLGWLSAHRWIGITSNGLVQYDLQNKTSARLDAWSLPNWYQVGQVTVGNSTLVLKNQAAKLNKKVLQIENSRGDFTASRIQFTDAATGKTQVLVPEMCNFKANWK